MGSGHCSDTSAALRISLSGEYAHEDLEPGAQLHSAGGCEEINSFNMGMLPSEARGKTAQGLEIGKGRLRRDFSHFPENSHAPPPFVGRPDFYTKHRLSVILDK